MIAMYLHFSFIIFFKFVAGGAVAYNNQTCCHACVVRYTYTKSIQTFTRLCTSLKKKPQIKYFTGISGDVMTVAPDVTIEFTCSGPVSVIQPTWFLNGTFVETEGNCYRSRLRRLGELNATATLTISGNYDACVDFNIYCRIFRESQFLYLHNTILTFEG